MVCVCDETSLPCSPRFLDVFNDTALIQFPLENLNKLPECIWTEPSEPLYQHCQDLEIIQKEKRSWKYHSLKNCVRKIYFLYTLFFYSKNKYTVVLSFLIGVLFYWDLKVKCFFLCTNGVNIQSWRQYGSRFLPEDKKKVTARFKCVIMRY